MRMMKSFLILRIKPIKIFEKKITIKMQVHLKPF